MTRIRLIDDENEQPNDNWPLWRSRQWNRERVDKGSDCLNCGKRIKRYHRHMSAFTARVMIAMYQWATEDDYIHVPTLITMHVKGNAQGGYATISYLWGLIEEDKRHRDDGGRAGNWRLTQKGRRFVRREISVPFTAVTLLNEVEWYEGHQVWIDDVLKEPFSLRDIL